MMKPILRISAICYIIYLVWIILLILRPMNRDILMACSESLALFESMDLSCKNSILIFFFQILTKMSLSSDDNVKLFGINWNKSRDTYETLDCSLDGSANTRRSILSSINSVYDPLGISLPTLN